MIHLYKEKVYFFMKKIKDFFKSLDKKEKLALILGTVLPLLIRCLWLNGKSGDYIGFLKPWVDYIRELGQFESLKYNIGNYNIPYIFILTIISFFKGEPLYLIKFVSIIFDYICAIYGAKIVYKTLNDRFISIITYITVLCLPTVIINGAMWGQCDSIFTAFTLISIYYLLDKKYIKSFIFLGISFSFKLQAIFILPLYVLMLFRDKNIKWYYFLLIPLANLIMCLPAIIVGRNFIEVMLIYFNQTGYYDTLVMNYPNLYNFFIKDAYFYTMNYELITKIGILFTMFMYFCIWVYVILGKIKFNKEKIITVAIWSIMIATFFLPRMHDRYAFVIDILSVIWFLMYFKKFYVVIVINLVSFISYLSFLFDYDLIDYRILSVIYFIVVFLFTIHTLKTIDIEEVKITKRQMYKDLKGKKVSNV